MNPVLSSVTAGKTRAARIATRLASAVVAIAATAAVCVGNAAPASAFVESGAAWAQETVTCNSAAHTVTLDIMGVGYGSGQIGGSDLFPYELQMPVYVKVSEYVGGRWVTNNAWQNALGNRHVVVGARGTTYWFFHFAFQTPSGGFVYRNEWAGGGPASGLYSNQRGYRALRSCYS
jgi:hypothetical protein